MSGSMAAYKQAQEDTIMAGIIFYRERTKIGEGKKMPHFALVAVSGIDLTFHVTHVRKQELEQIAAAVKAKLVELKVDKKKKQHDDVEC
jgi:hypothetical protein